MLINLFQIYIFYLMLMVIINLIQILVLDYRLFIIYFELQQAAMTDRRFIHHHNLNPQGDLLKVECRFCHSLNPFNKYKHIAPCGCAGDTRYVHRQCMEKWVTVKFQQVYNETNQEHPQKFNIFCQVCQQRMEIQFSLANKCNSYDDLLQKLSANKVLLAFLMLFGALGLIGIVVGSILAGKNGFETWLIVGLALSGVAFVVAVIIFLIKFLMKKSIVIDRLPNNKDPPKIIGYQKDFEDIEAQSEEKERPHFGQGTFRKKKMQPEPSLMIESKLQKQDGASSMASKTLTHYVMRKMYKHDWMNNRDSVHPSQPPTTNRDIAFTNKQIQINDLDRKSQAVQMASFSKHDKEVQPSLKPGLRDQGIQPSQTEPFIRDQGQTNNQSFRKSRRKIFAQNKSVAQQMKREYPPPKYRAQKQGPSQMSKQKSFQRKESQNERKPDRRERKGIQYEKDQTQYKPRYQQQDKRSRQLSRREPEMESEKKSQQALYDQKQKKKGQKIKLNSISDPIKIKVRF